MAFAGLKKQINKANQYVTEKMGGAEGTKLDLDFMDMERKTDVTVELVEELQMKTKEFLQPNPTARAKMAAVKGISKLSGQAKSNTYPQPEGVLGDCMLHYGKKLGEDSIFAQSLIEMGESMKQMADVKYSLDDNIKQNFLEPLHHLQTKDLKEVMHHRKKLQGRRLDFDCKKRRQAKVYGRVSPYGSPSHNQNVARQDDEIRQAEEKFAESLHLAQLGMFNLLDNEVEQLAQMTSFSEGLLEYHQQCVEILNVLVQNLREKTEEAAARPKMEFVPKTLADLNIDGFSTDGSHGLNNGRPSHSYHSGPNTIGSTHGSSQNLSSHSNNNTSNLRHSSSIGNLSSKQSSVGWSVHNPRMANSSSFNERRPTSNNNGVRRDDPFTSGWDETGASAGWGGRPSRGTQPPSRPPQQHNLDPWSDFFKSALRDSGETIHCPHACGGSNSGSPVHGKPNNLELFPGGNSQSNAQRSTNASPLPSPMKSPARTPMVPPTAASKNPCCTALYDFEPENPGELGFKENDVITLINKVDDNWYEGSVNGRTGYFPVSYVQVTVPLP